MSNSNARRASRARTTPDIITPILRDGAVIGHVTRLAGPGRHYTAALANGGGNVYPPNGSRRTFWFDTLRAASLAVGKAATEIERTQRRSKARR